MKLAQLTEYKLTLEGDEARLTNNLKVYHPEGLRSVTSPRTAYMHFVRALNRRKIDVASSTCATLLLRTAVNPAQVEGAVRAAINEALENLQ